MKLSEKLKGTLENLGAEKRSIPFWSWNDKLDPEELREQIRDMKSVGIGGFFMHARGGLRTEYMGEEWMQCIEACADEAEKQGMHAWAYDENGWPSGFGGGAVLDANPDYHIRWILSQESETFPETDEFTLGVYGIKGNDAEKVTAENGAEKYVKVYFKVNPYYVDLMNKECIKTFIEVTHEKYKERVGTNGAVKGFFTDEPQYATGRLPWGAHYAIDFKEKYGYDITDKLAHIFYDLEGATKVRYDYWNLVSELMNESFMKQISDWCHENNMLFTGHMMMEENIHHQIRATAGVMPAYEYFDVPGMDYLGRRTSDPVQPKQVGSVAAQLGKERTLTETYALCGWDVSPEELKCMGDWHYVHGINLMCQHLEPYTMRGLRKRDYPAFPYRQNSWWNEYGIFNEYFARLGELLRQGKEEADVLFIHPMKSAYVVSKNTDADKNPELVSISNNHWKTAHYLSEAKVGWHFGDETIMKKYGSVENGEIKIGKCSYKKVIMSEMPSIDKSTLDILKAFAEQGGEIYTTGSLPTMVEGVPCDCTKFLHEAAKKVEMTPEALEEVFGADNTVLMENARDVHVQVRHIGDEKVIFLSNILLEKGYPDAVVKVKAEKVAILDILNMKTIAVDYEKKGEYVEFKLPFLKRQSYIIVTGEDGEKQPEATEIVKFEGEFKVKDFGVNAITLDACQYRVDGGEWQPKDAIISIMDTLLARQQNCDVELKAEFEYYGESKELFLVVEDPWLFEIYMNGKKVPAEDCGWWIDKTFRKLNVSGYEKQGMNEIVVKAKFFQRDEVYQVLFGENVLETMKNKLTLDMELESMYLLGDFGVYSKDPYVPGERKALFTEDNFVIKKAPETVTRGNLVEQGFAFYQGKITLEKVINIENPEHAVLDLGTPKCSDVIVTVNGHELEPKLWGPWTFDIGEYAVKGENVIDVTLCISPRNLLGPHHRADGENYFIAPPSFKKFKHAPETWRDGYCFVYQGFED